MHKSAADPRGDRGYGARLIAAAFLLLLTSATQGQSSAAEGCNTVRVYPFPLNAQRPLTAQIHRTCPTSSTFLETVSAAVSGDVIRVETSCTSTPLPAFSCQIGQAEIGIIDSGTYAVDVVDEDTGTLLFSDSLTVGRVTSVPTLRGVGLAVAALLVLGVGLMTLFGQPGRSLFSNSRS